MTKTDEKLVIRWPCETRECVQEFVQEFVQECAEEDLVLNSNLE